MASLRSAASEGARKSAGTRAECTAFLLGYKVYIYYFYTNFNIENEKN